MCSMGSSTATLTIIKKRASIKIVLKDDVRSVLASFFCVGATIGAIAITIIFIE